MVTMRTLLQTISPMGPSHTLEKVEAGYLLARRPDGDRAEFNKVARQAINLAGAYFVALPRTDGAMGYDHVIIMTFS
ncbi:MAG: hypothetical protein ACK4VY_01045 [Brevundimonas sp.]